ncbi:NmrA family transcriptional regulator [Aspergillus sclerotioniger CBS 115572]|uniref:NmrA family transcriptional regulator n=1 Tax=Aspergillus sclerotioniger CBS 115572 TaxID=1450535 RepID=A0A317WLE6_9EURO|nr:NmrA family transcriptional regulator [Aspergillus sclerotioniger CBS 115572]PWY87213.1 NmrA family transcriptional regulator [Aspergillus sclerotioniger CBS 115572]
MTPPKTIVVFGATGQQGGSLIQYILNDPHLSSTYQIRAITRDPSTPAAQSLKTAGVEVFPADANDPSSLLPALQNSHMVFSMTLPNFFAPDAKQIEIAQGKAIADAAVASGTEHIIFSTLPHVSKISNGKYTKVEYFDAKAEVEEYIRGLPIKSTFYAPGWFMQNFGGNMRPRTVEGADGKKVLVNVVGPGTKLPLIDPSRDTGVFLGGVLREPERWLGRVVQAAAEVYSYEEVAGMMSEVLGVEVQYQVVEREVFEGDLPPVFADRLVEMVRYIEEFGYFGPGTEEMVSRTVGETKDRLTTLREYLVREGKE